MSSCSVLLLLCLLAVHAISSESRLLSSGSSLDTAAGRLLRQYLPLASAAQGCSAGQYPTSQGGCQACPKGSWCSGGAAVPVPCSSSSGSGLTTQKQGATSAKQCVVPPGMKLVKKGSSQVEACPKGQFRAGFAGAADALALKCSKCSAGSTTTVAAATKKQDCKVLLPGYYWSRSAAKKSGKPRAAGSVAPAQAADPVPRMCPQNSWCPGGIADATVTPTACPNGLWTEAMGATSQDECRVPPGHFLQGTGPTAAVTPCTTGSLTATPAQPGTYQPDWLLPSDAAAAACKSCGAGILSFANEPLAVFAPDDDGTGRPKLLSVAATNISCYIRQGQGMVLDTAAGSTTADPIYKAVTCSSNSVGVPDTQYGLEEAPCSECPDNMITANLFKSAVTGGYYDVGACLVPPGYGYYGGGAAPCVKGEYNEGLDSPRGEDCKACPADGLTTPGPDGAVASAAECRCVLPGYGYDAARTVSKCPVGTYSDAERCWQAGSSSGAAGPCTTCPGGRTTRRRGATSADACNMCPPGSGTSSSSSSCSPCPSGSFGSSFRAEGDTACAACPTQAVLLFRINGDVNAYTPAAISAPGASSEDGCMPDFSATEDGNWQLPVAAGGLVDVTASDASVNNLEKCTAACLQKEQCQLVSFDYASNSCLLRVAAAGSSSVRIAFKINSGEQLLRRAPSTAAAAAAAKDTDIPAQTQQAIKPRDMGIGIFSWWSDATAASVGLEMPNPTPSSGPLSASECVQTCNDLSECAAVVITSDAAGGVSGCSLRKGETGAGNSVRTLVRTRTSTVDAL
ncbi:hypothetical protein OEZ85_000386 [Tetradesmus obliquus]|uniref:Apple domain-containing protein n=1 Tax=Tetradesmus obliquus TaxID=3088 RepID=A0ABY8UQ42_TETOB|nr:hypothetical protein OEZ85_000386 [Tetradesmus obliquus]